MTAIVTIDEVFAGYPDEWILLDELSTADGLSVQAGRVVAHDPVRSVVEAAAIALRLERCAMVCAKKREDGSYAVARDYAVSPITSSAEIEAEVMKAG